MKCKHHPAREAEHFCASCGIPLCGDCAEEVKPEEFYCFQCAMLQSVSAVGTTIKDKKQKAAEKKLAGKEKKKGPFQYFIIVSSVLILVMWGVIIFGGQKSPAGSGEFAKNERAFLFMIDSSIKRYAHYEKGQYPEALTDLVPRYLRLSEANLPLLGKFSYATHPVKGYTLTQAKPKPGEMTIILSPKGIEYKTLPTTGA
ncbi:MAG: hypothetical protein JW821_15735 [Deltaproteobacteria bacterium]|nr:hypothetical protein [Deltaproteobacteria bacterium]